MRRTTHPALIALTALTYLFLVGPIVIVIGAAFSDTGYLAFPPEGLTVRWFVNAWEVTAFRTTFLTSLQVAVLATTLSLAIGVPAAYAMAKYRGGLPPVLATVFVLPILVPEIVFGFSMLRSVAIGLDVPILPALVLGHALLVLPYTVRVTAASLASFDFAAEEAAVSLGSPPWRAFFTIVLPNIRAGLIAAFILAFITSLNDVSISLFLTGPGLSTLPIQLLAYVEQFFDPTIASVSVLLMVLTVTVMAVVERTLGLSFMARPSR